MVKARKQILRLRVRGCRSATVPQGFGCADSYSKQTTEKSFYPRYVSYSLYRKPTQVGEERILRCSRESWPRNSAKLPRNFGKRGP